MWRSYPFNYECEQRVRLRVPFFISVVSPLSDWLSIPGMRPGLSLHFLSLLYLERLDASVEVSYGSLVRGIVPEGRLGSNRGRKPLSTF
jgi:hypothetical protein